MYMFYVALTVLFLHIVSLPLTVRVEFSIGSDERSATVFFKLYFIPILKLALDYDKFAVKAKNAEISPPTEKKKRSKPKGYFLRAGLNFIKLVDVRYVGLNCAIGTGDAASTALLCGGAASAFEGACGALCCQKYSIITPDYDNTRLELDLGGIISFSFADIIYAAVSAFGKRNSFRTAKPIAASSV